MGEGSRHLRAVPDSEDTHGESEETMWGPTEAAKYLRKSRSWVYQHAHTLPHFRLGGELRFRPSSLREYVRGLEAAAKKAQG